jgi:hypothetical protein
MNWGKYNVGVSAGVGVELAFLSRTARVRR